jgi:hypothetical protein
MNIETMKEVLQAWDAYNNASDSQEDAKAHSSMVVAFAKLRTAIEQAEKQEPVAWMDASETALSWENYLDDMKPLYTTQPAAQRQWVGLTDVEIEEWDYEVRDVVMDIEKLLREKNT